MARACTIHPNSSLGVRLRIFAECGPLATDNRHGRAGDFLIGFLGVTTSLATCGSTIFHPPMISASRRVTDTRVMHIRP